MANSMTGYGRAEFVLGEGENYTIEVKSLNHRYLEVNNRCPERFFAHDISLREFLKNKFARGAFSVNINYSKKHGEDLKVNIPLAKAYLDASLELKNSLGLDGELDIPAVMRIKDIMSGGRSDEVDTDADWKELKSALEKASNDLSVMRKKEGEKLVKDINSRLDAINDIRIKVEELSKGTVDKYRERLTQKIKDLIGDNADEQRIINEAAVLAERTDISEEVTRLEIHIEKMKEFLLLKEPVGRKCDFLCQELLREVNTIGSKTDNIDVTSLVVEAKGEVEKVREQIQNLE